ncbi:MAG: LPS export ABC transporter periplasmic protein LptC [Candidatus Omnitrophica bacterium]|nr:LPS export ABC transporter periplasmic protein LptC [Candidatus Omnitrophota bacterium]
MKKNKTLIIIAVVLSIIILHTFGKVKKARMIAVSLKDVPQAVEQKILSFDLSNYAEDGSKKWQLKGDSADVLSEIVNLNNIVMETYDDPKVDLTAIRGAYDKDNKEIKLYDDVVVITSDGIRLTTDYLKWDGNTDTVSTDQHVKIVRNDVVATGIGALALPQMKKVILNKDVIVKLAKNVMQGMDMSMDDSKKEDDGPPQATITCDGRLEINYEENTAVFNDNVLVEDKKGKIYSDKMDAFLDPVTKDILKVIAEGDVKVVRGEDSTFSRKAIYTTHDQKIVLVGRPRIYIRSSNDDMKDMEKGFKGLR